jgi:predicted ABC-type transport system involved in lysophospholipase L1 biosynthesis ATPase subunit
VLAGVDGLAPWMRLAAGRLPSGCSAARCEVVQVTGGRLPRQLVLNDVRLRVVGSGRLKTTVLHLIAGLDRPDHGTVTLAGTKLDTLDRTALAKPRAERVAIVTQVSTLIARLSAAANAALGLRARGWTAAPARERAREALQEVGLGDLLKRPASGLSGGERQRVALARAWPPTPHC